MCVTLGLVNFICIRKLWNSIISRHIPRYCFFYQNYNLIYSAYGGIEIKWNENCLVNACNLFHINPASVSTNRFSIFMPFCLSIDVKLTFQQGLLKNFPWFECKIKNIYINFIFCLFSWIYQKAKIVYKI